MSAALRSAFSIKIIPKHNSYFSILTTDPLLETLPHTAANIKAAYSNAYSIKMTNHRFGGTLHTLGYT